MFRSSNDGGATFTDKINLSNTTEADSWRVVIHGEGDNVVVSGWEMNRTSDVPVARVSNDSEATFGPLMMLDANGTLGSGEAEAVGAQEKKDKSRNKESGKHGLRNRKRNLCACFNPTFL